MPAAEWLHAAAFGGAGGSRGHGDAADWPGWQGARRQCGQERADSSARSCAAEPRRPRATTRRPRVHRRSTHKRQPSFFGERGEVTPTPPQKCTVFPKTAGQIVCFKSFFFCRCNDLLIDRGNILLMDSKLRKLFVTRQSKGCKFMPKCTEVRLLAGLCADPLGGDYPLLRPLSRNGDAAYF